MSNKIYTETYYKHRCSFYVFVISKSISINKQEFLLATD